MKRLVGTLKRSDLEGGVWVFEAEDGHRYHLDGLDPSLHQDGAVIEVQGEDSSAMGFGMMGATLKVRSARRL